MELGIATPFVRTAATPIFSINSDNLIIARETWADPCMWKRLFPRLRPKNVGSATSSRTTEREFVSAKKRIGELLIESQVITLRQLEEALAMQKRCGGRICQILISLGHLTEQQLSECLQSPGARQLAQTDQYYINPALTQVVPAKFAHTCGVLPLGRESSTLTMAMAGPYDEKVPTALTKKTHLNVRTILANRQTVERAIEQYYGPRIADESARAFHEIKLGPEALRLRNVLLILEYLDKFPLLPDTYVRLMERIIDPEVEIESLTPLIEQDPTLTSNLLKLANSAAYNRNGQFDGVHRAVVFLGLRQLQSMVRACAVMTNLKAEADFDLHVMFAASYRCGMLTKIVCDVTRFGDPDVAFTAGLLSNIGQIVLRMFSEEYFQLIEERARTEDAESSYLQRFSRHVHAEESVLGISTSELGYQLAHRWKLPETLADTIRYHDRLDRIAEPPPITIAVALAKYCLRSLEHEAHFGNAMDDPELAWLLAAMGQSPEVLSEIEERYNDGEQALQALESAIA